MRHSSNYRESDEYYEPETTDVTIYHKGTTGSRWEALYTPEGEISKVYLYDKVGRCVQVHGHIDIIDNFFRKHYGDEMPFQHEPSESEIDFHTFRNIY